MDLYPLQFKAISVETEWGSDLYDQCFSTETGESIGIIYQLVSNDKYDSVVTNGPLAGKKLSEIDRMGETYMGRRRIKGFPICIKYLSTASSLGLHVYPDEIALKTVDNVEMKDKVWYVVSHCEYATIQAEMKQTHTMQQLLSRVGTPAIYDVVYEFDSAVGDSYYLPSGRIHGLGAGNLILSVEDEKGTAIKLDEDSYLDTENSIYTEDHEIIKLCVNSKNRSTPRNRSESSIVSRNRKLALVNNSPFVELEELRLVTMLHDRTNRNAFHFLIAIDGAINIKTAKGDLELQPGDNAFIPAAIGAYSVTPIGDVARVIRVIPKRL